ncbi:unnamed protein product [Candida verbasci]|uniref:Uncharacterized protein n=1 Tax=Candida verbasci TaxID=1227364 RepID=A0A9W4TRJ8_9ASCO|nr:unnamed protein product [Candida verbasci]
MILPTTLNGGGVLAYGLGAYYQSHWAISVVIGQSLLGFSMSASGTICLTYAVDCYHKVAGESIVLILFVRNMIGMIFCFVCQPWLNNCGLMLTTWLIFLITTLINSSFILMVVSGKSFRRRTIRLYDKFSNPLFGELFK